MSVAIQQVDKDLLRQYAESGSQSAFAELVAVHTDFVYSVARRRVRGDAHMAADVTQAVFLVLARKAITIGPEVILPGWLFRTTRYAASVALRAQARRRHHERKAAGMRPEESEPVPKPSEQGDGLWKHIEPLLDGAMDRLNSADRTVILLRFFQHKSLREVGEVMLISEDTAQKRVSRAVDKLRGLLVARGVVMGSAAALAIVLAEHSVQAAPAAMSASLVAVAAGQTAAPAAATTLSATIASGVSGVGAKAMLVVSAAALVLAGLATAILLPRFTQPPAASPIARVFVAATSIEPTVLLGEAPPPLALDLGDGQTLEVVGVPPGIFTKGRPENEEGRGPPHRVRIGYAFYMAKFSVTQAQWIKVMGSNPSQFRGDDRRPVEQVSWDDCQEFCRRVTQLTGQKVRLPSESEREHACRAGTTTIWSFGNDANDLDDYAWHSIVRVDHRFIPKDLKMPATLPLANADESTHPVGLKRPNPWGLYDMHGNVFEWCQDIGPYYRLYDATDPIDGSPRVSTEDRRMVRGGHWASDHLMMTFSSYNWSLPRDHRGNNVGLRVVVELTPAAGF